ncbi:hypothetical protein C0993_008849 [Termitomyces sp. T159_Od127]|nr:hypothetical protein C0993_008849 [Termitomyces sp. T159_Od127]
MDAQGNNPYEQVCPDFASEAFTEARNSLRKADDGIDDATAVVMMTQVWNATNRAERAAWDTRIREDGEREAQRLHGEEQARGDDLREQEERVAASDEMKRNRTKYLDIPMRPPPTLPVEIPSRYATAKLQKGQYVELWYFTNVGLRHARATDATLDEDAMVAIAGRDGRVDLVPAAVAKESKQAVPNRLLTWDNFTVAVRRILFAMEAAAWTEQRIRMLANFWGKLQAHPYRSSPDHLDTEALLLYQDEQRRAWHQAIGSPAGAWDISIIDETVLARTQEEVYRDDRRKRDRERDGLLCSKHEKQREGGPRELAALFPSNWVDLISAVGAHPHGRGHPLMEETLTNGDRRADLQGGVDHHAIPEGRVFATAQARFWPSAPSVLAETHIESSTATMARPGTAAPRPSQKESIEPWSCAMATTSAAIGSASKDVDNPTTKDINSVLDE